MRPLKTLHISVYKCTELGPIRYQNDDGYAVALPPDRWQMLALGTHHHRLVLTPQPIRGATTGVYKIPTPLSSGIL